MNNIAYTPLNALGTIAMPNRVLIVSYGECRTRMQFGLYFDGTNNNFDEDKLTLSQSNVARLFSAAYDEPSNGLIPIYIPGVGTPFNLIGEITPHEYGAAKGAMGAERIRCALLLMVNRISQVLQGREIVTRDKVAMVVKDSRNFAGWKRSLTNLVARTRQAVQGVKVEEIVLDVFGFSRGAAGARSFVNQLLKHFCSDGSEGAGLGATLFCGIPLRIRFMGLFDTVASVGYADSMPFPCVEGHQDWGDEDLLVIPPQVEQCVHFVAGHEGRKSFPVDLVLRKDGSYPANCIEVVYPGVHSDVGGGYGPGDQGKARGDQKRVLSKIALRDMYLRALEAGVPLQNAEALRRADLYQHFDVSDDLDRSYKAYLSFMEGSCKGRSAVRQYESHLRHYLHWRREVLSDARFSEQPCMGDGIGAQDRTNLRESNAEFRRYIKTMEKIDADQTRIDERATMYGDPSTEKPRAASPALRYYRKYWKDKFMSHPDVHNFLEAYVHDSRAGFTIVDPVSRHDHRRIHQRLKKLDLAYQNQVLTGIGGGFGSHAVAGAEGLPPPDPLTRREREILAIYNKTPDAPEENKPYIEVPLYDDSRPGAYDDGEVGVTDLIAGTVGRRESGWSYLHPRQHFAYSRIVF